MVPLYLHFAQAAVVIIFAIVGSLCIWGIYTPKGLTRWVTRLMDQSGGIVVAVLVRLILGAVLIVLAPLAKFPLVFQVLGWITIVAALVLAIAGQNRVRRLLAWLEPLPSVWIRLWLVFGFCFCVFLIYGAL